MKLLFQMYYNKIDNFRKLLQRKTKNIYTNIDELNQDY